MVLENWCENKQKANGVENGVDVQNMILSNPINQGIRTYHRNGLQIPNNRTHQSLVLLDFKPFARLLFIIFITKFHGFSLSKIPFMVWIMVWKNWCGK